MPTGDGAVWDESTPNDGTFVNQGDDHIRDVRKGVRARLALEHVWPTTQTGTADAGYHTYITFSPQTGVPTMPVVASTTQSGMFFMTAGHLMFQNSAGSVATLISSGKGLNVQNAVYSSTGTQGDMLIGSTGGVLKVLAASTDGMVLVTHTNTGDPTWLPVSSVAGVTILDYAGATATGTPQGLNTLKIAFGAITVAGNSTTTVSGLPFTSTGTYKVAIGNYSLFPAIVTRVSGAAFSLTNTHNDAVGGNGNGEWIALGY